LHRVRFGCVGEEDDADQPHAEAEGQNGVRLHAAGEGDFPEMGGSTWSRCDA
jgi:hypothetical protein